MIRKREIRLLFLSVALIIVGADIVKEAFCIKDYLTMPWFVMLGLLMLAIGLLNIAENTCSKRK